MTFRGWPSPSATGVETTLTGSSMVHALVNAFQETLTPLSETSNSPPPSLSPLTLQFINTATDAVTMLISLFAVRIAVAATFRGPSPTLTCGTLPTPLADACPTSAHLRAILIATANALLPLPVRAMETAIVITHGPLTTLLSGTQPRACAGANQPKSLLRSITAPTALTPTTCSAVPIARNAASLGPQVTPRNGTQMMLFAAARRKTSRKSPSVIGALL